MSQTAKRPVSTTSEPVGATAAGDVVTGYLAVQVAQLRAQEPLVRAGDPEGVHQMRVALRRLRSALVSYRPVFDGTVTEPLRSELAWLGGVLGPARDIEVLRGHLTARLHADGRADLLLHAQVARQLDGRLGEALGDVRRVLDGPRYRQLEQALAALVSSPPLTGDAARTASTALPARVEKSWRLLHDAVRAARAEGLDEATRTARLHEVRKKAKRVRYAAEVLQPLYGRPATRFVREMTRLQTSLGDTQDGAVIVPELDRLAAGVDNALALGRIQVLEEQRIAAQVVALDPVWRRASRRALRRWLR